MPDIVRRETTSVIEKRGASRGVVKRTTKAVQKEESRGVVLGTKLESAAYVAHVGMTYTDMLTDQEIRMAERCPERQYRAKLIVDSYAGMVASTIARMGLE